MSNSNSTASSGGIGLGTAVFLIFLTLKLTHVIDWSWWWVTAPLWGPIVALLSFILIAALLIGGTELLAKLIRGD